MRFAAPKQTERWHCTCTAIVQPCSLSVCAASIFIWYCVLCTGVFCRPTLNKKEVSALCFQYVQLTEQKPPNNLKMKWTLPLFGCWKPSPRSNTLKSEVITQVLLVMNLYIVQQQNSPNHAFVSDQTKCINVSIGIVNVMDGIISFIVVHHCTINTVHDADIPHVTLQRSKMIYVR